METFPFRSSLHNLSLRHWKQCQKTDLLVILFGWVWRLLEWRLFASLLYSGRFLRQTISREGCLQRIFPTCAFVAGRRETIDHFFLHCLISYFMWHQVINRSGVHWCFPKIVSDMIKVWRMSPFSRCGMMLWRLVPFAILWSVWKERNDRVFKGFPLYSKVATRREFNNISVNGIFHSW